MNQHINMASIVRTYDFQLGELGCKHGLVATGLCNSVHPWLAIANLYIFKQTLLVLTIFFGSIMTDLLFLQVMVVFNRSIILALQNTANDPPSDVSWSNQRVQEEYIHTNISSKFFALVRSVQLRNSLISTISILLPSKLKNGSLSGLSHTFTCES